MNNIKISIDEIRLALQTSLLGEIYSEIRAIAFAFDSIKKSFTLRYYLNRRPTDVDYESVSIVMTEFLSFFRHSDFD